MAIDRTTGTGHGHLYQMWTIGTGPTGDSTFNRSIDEGEAFQRPLVGPPTYYGTLDIAPDGTLYTAGARSGFHGADDFVVSRSTSARDPLAAPTFTMVPVDLGGSLAFGGPPFPNGGLLSQIWVAVDPSQGSTAGYVYVLATLNTPRDSLDVQFVRSTDGGDTWSAPVRVKDDPPGAFQWFGTMSVSPNGRIDVVWNDTRNWPGAAVSELFYSYSTDGGVTWSPNEQASPAWNCYLGAPPLNLKVGDYYDMISDRNGAHLAWAATLNNEQDVYYMYIPSLVPVAVGEPAAHHHRLHANLPNPFSTSTTIRFEMPSEGGHMKLDVFDVKGRRVRDLLDGFVTGGPHSVRWNGTDGAGRALAAGVYFCRLEGAGHSSTRRMVLIESDL
jgi:flagellar hook capping protein FlgD